MAGKINSFFDSQGNLHIETKWFGKNSRILGKKMLYVLLLKAKNSPYKMRKKVREVLGISETTEWRWRKELKKEGYL